MIIIGLSRSGKSRAAVSEAVKRGGLYVVTSWGELRTRFGLGRILEGNPATVIVEGLSLSDRGAVNRLKELASDDHLLIDLQYEDQRAVPAPFFIFTMPADPASPAVKVLGQSSWSRFEVITLGQRNEALEG